MYFRNIQEKQPHLFALYFLFDSKYHVYFRHYIHIYPYKCITDQLLILVVFTITYHQLQIVIIKTFLLLLSLFEILCNLLRRIWLIAKKLFSVLLSFHQIEFLTIIDNHGTKYHYKIILSNVYAKESTLHEVKII